ncbi:MAG: hypothetical protein HYV29_12415 [Ignavibacteriales bacterium]|nr:hypothetical protein [Ignavibacteriales bacterium]
MRPFILVMVIVVLDGCRVYRRIPEDGVAYSRRYNFVLRSELEFEDHFVDRRLVRSVAFHPNGRKAYEMNVAQEDQVMMQIDYYYTNGQKMRESMYITDTLVVENEWYTDGMQRLNFVRGADRQQFVIRWHNNGIKKEESEWTGNTRNGKFIEWDSSGRRVHNETYRNGVKIQ